MGLEFNLLTVTEFDASKIEAELAALPSVRVDDSAMSATGLELIVVTKLIGRATRNQIQEMFSISPTLTVSFVVDAEIEDNSGYAGVATAIQLSVNLLEVLDTDGVLLLNGETPVFVRVSERVTLNSTYFKGDPREVIFRGMVYAKIPLANL